MSSAQSVGQSSAARVAEPTPRHSGRKSEAGGSGFASLVNGQSGHQRAKSFHAHADHQLPATDDAKTTHAALAKVKQDNDEAQAASDGETPRRAVPAQVDAAGAKRAPKPDMDHGATKSADGNKALLDKVAPSIGGETCPTDGTIGQSQSDSPTNAAKAAPRSSAAILSEAIFQATDETVAAPDDAMPQPASDAAKAKVLERPQANLMTADADADPVVTMPEPKPVAWPKEPGRHADERKPLPRVEAHATSDAVKADTIAAANVPVVEFREAMTTAQPPAEVDDTADAQPPAKSADTAATGAAAPLASTAKTAPQAVQSQSHAHAPSGPAATPAAKAQAKSSAPAQGAAPASAAAPATAAHAPAPAPALAQAATTSTVAPPAFSAELTVAAANYSINASKVQPDESAPPISADPATAESDQPVRITVLGSSTRAAPPMPFVPTQTQPQASFGQVSSQPSATPRVQDIDDRAKRTQSPADDRPAPTSVAPAAQRLSAAETAHMPTVGPAGSNPTATVTATIAQELNLRPAHVADVSHQGLRALPQETKTLSIQLHPAELGVVTATLRLAGEQLAVELSADNEVARKRLSADSDEIVRSLRRLGLDVDQVQIVQPTAAAQTPTRGDDSAAQSNLPQRGQSLADNGASGSGGNRLGGQQSGRQVHEGAAQPQPGLAKAADGSGSLYI